MTEPVEDYPWPCWLRTAHGPHPIESTVELTDKQLADSLVDIAPDGEITCPGVKAHPLTMIGRK